MTAALVLAYIGSALWTFSELARSPERYARIATALSIMILLAIFAGGALSGEI